jgi:NACalpha-BTF3-like transcription factor
MKLMKYIPVALALLFCTVAVAQEQVTSVSPADQAKKMTGKMTKSLALTPDQIPQVEAVNLKVAEKRQSLKESDATKKEIKAEMDLILNAELKAVLNEAQWDNFSEIRKKKEIERKERAERGRLKEDGQ